MRAKPKRSKKGKATNRKQQSEPVVDAVAPAPEPVIEPEDEPRDGLTPKRRAFAYEFMKDRNATQAAVRAGYSAHTADQQGCRLLTNVKVAALIEDAERRVAIRAGINADFVLDATLEILDRSLQRRPVMEFDRAEKTYIQATDGEGNDLWTYDSNGAIKAATLLSKYTGGFSERHEHSGPGGGPIEIADAEELRKRLHERITGIASRMGTNGSTPRLNGNGARHT